ncbi:MAG: polyamine ABC transporter ATP-binding protein [Planctomycetes bacterium]|nr:polyamine ABC transporter ATP-binding protein [Planctomycetota bacterium]
MVGSPGITTSGLACGYGGRPVLSDIDLELPAGSTTCILGRSGCGKSTLLRTLLLLEEPLAGEIRFGNIVLSELVARGLDDLRRSIGVLFQGSALFNSMTLLENVAFPLLESTRVAHDLARDLALLKLDLVGLSPFAHYLPAAVSGGMRKRCGIARALALDPPFLFLDEPNAGLDPITSAEIDRLVIEIKETLGTTIVVVTHEVRSIETIGDHLVMLSNGGVAAQGRPDVIRVSGHPAVTEFFARRPVPPPSNAAGGLGSLLLPPEE